MISLEELHEIKEKRKTNLYYEEKEYLQYIFLNSISKYTDGFVFKGGTCLRICFGHERASEDLDFSTNLGIEKVKDVVEKCLKDFDFLGIKYETYSLRAYEGNLRMEVRFEGPLFAGKRASTNTLKIDFNKGRIKNKIANVIQKLFSDVPLFVLVVSNEKEILVEKIRSLTRRAEPRDLYDVWMLLSRGVKIDVKLLFEKLNEEKTSLSKLKFPSKEEYEITLKNLINYTPPYEQVKTEVSKAINKIKKIKFGRGFTKFV